MRALLLSAYAAASHQHWARTLQRMCPAWEWQMLELPPRHFSWRIRGNPLHWSQAERALLEQDYDVVVATSMVDLATLRGLVPALARRPSLLYFHENQFAYPPGRSRHSPLEAQMVSLYSALAADRLAFNSAWNRDSFLDGLESLLQRLPDYVPAGLVEALADKSEILPVPVESALEAGSGHPWPETVTKPLRLLWVGRFEHDKGADRLQALLRELAARNVAFQLAVAGQQFRDSPAEFEQIRSEFSEQLQHFGYLPERADLYRLMQGADLVLSTATHEFQGLAVMEAVQLGCVPVVPDRLAYPELYHARYRYVSGDLATEASAAADRIETLAEALRRGEVGPPSLQAYTPAQLAQAYDRLLRGLATG